AIVDKIDSIERVELNDDNAGHDAESNEDHGDLDVTSPDVRRPSTMGMSFCADLPPGSALTIRLPSERTFVWQGEEDPPFPLNGRYEHCARVGAIEGQATSQEPVWRRLPAVDAHSVV